MPYEPPSFRPAPGALRKPATPPKPISPPPKPPEPPPEAPAAPQPRLRTLRGSAEASEPQNASTGPVGALSARRTPPKPRSDRGIQIVPTISVVQSDVNPHQIARDLGF